MMPAALANAREGGLAEPHFELVSQHEADDEFLAARLRALATGHRCGKYVRRMRLVLLPIDVVVVHATNHQRIGKRSGHGIHLLASSNHGGRTPPGDFLQHLERDLYVVLLISAERAAHGIEQKALGLINRLLREVRVIESGGPAGHFGGDGLFEGCGSGGQSVFSGQSLVLGRWSLVLGPWLLVVGRGRPSFVGGATGVLARRPYCILTSRPPIAS